MRKKLLIIFAIISPLIVCVFIYSCAKHESMSPSSTFGKTEAQLISDAKSWHSATIKFKGKTSMANMNAALPLPVILPNWNSAKIKVLKDGDTAIIVRSRNVVLSSLSKVGVMRKFVFFEHNGSIATGEILEAYALSTDMAQDSTAIVENFINQSLNQFTGSIIKYDVWYNYITSNTYKAGQQINATAKIIRTAATQGTDTSSHGKASAASVLQRSLSLRPKANRPTALDAGDCTGSGCYDVYWVTTYDDGSSTWDYLYCDCDSGGDSELGGGINGGGGGGSPTPTNPPAPQGPCDQLNAMSQTSSFTQAESSDVTWLNGSSDDEQACITYSNNTYKFAEGGPTGNFPIGPYIQAGYFNNATGILHTHKPPNDLTTFSGDDLGAYYQIVSSGVITNPATFTFVLQTPTAEYALTITNMSAFLAFGNANFNTKANLESFNTYTYNNYVNSTNSESANLSGLETFINAMNVGSTPIGLTLMAKLPSGGWGAVSFDSAGNPVIVPCQ